MLEPDGRRVRRSHRRDLDSGGDGARWFAVRACDAGFGVDDDDARARCSRVETVEERRWWYSASRAGFWRVLGRVSLLSMSAPAVGSPEPREEITQLKVVLPRLKDLFCSVAKNAVAKNAHSDSANSLGLLFPDFNSANSLGLLFPDSDSANSLGRNSRRIRIQEPIKTAPDEPEENDVSKNVELKLLDPLLGFAILRAVCDSTRALDPAESQVDPTHSTR